MEAEEVYGLLKGKITQLNSDLTSISLTGNNTYPKNIIPKLNFTANHGWTKTGTYVEISGANAGKVVTTTQTDFYPVIAGEKFIATITRLSGTYTDGVPILFTDDSLVVKGFPIDADNAVNQTITVPEGATRMYVTYYCNQVFRLDKLVVASSLSEMPSVNQFSLVNQMDSLQAISKLYRLKYGTLDKAYITFIADDVRADIDAVYDVFQTYNLPLCSSCIASELPNICSDGVTVRKAIIDQMVTDGGEVLAHHTTTLTSSNYDFDTLYDHFAKTKETLQDYGYDVNGIILAGGVGQDTIDFADIEKWSRMYYLYSDLYGIAEPYRHPRYSIAYSYSTQEAFEARIQQAITDKEWVVFYMHSLTEISAENLALRLAYVAGLESTDIQCVNYKHMYDNFITSAVSGAVGKTLASISATKTVATYTEGDTLATNDIAVTATYSDDTTANVTTSAIFNTSAVNMAAAGTYNIVVTYTESGVTKTYNIPITITSASSLTYILQDQTYSGNADGLVTTVSPAIIANSPVDIAIGDVIRYDFDYSFDVSAIDTGAAITLSGGTWCGNAATTIVSPTATGVISGHKTFDLTATVAATATTWQSKLLGSNFIKLTTAYSLTNLSIAKVL
jgi:hypothetical protein